MEFVKLTDSAITPTRAYASAGYDLYADEDIELAYQGDWHLTSTGISIAIPEGHVGYIHAKSGLATKQGIVLKNGTGVIDADYRGEVKVPLMLNQDGKVVITKGQKIAQLVLHPIYTPTLLEVEELPDTERGEGGFGSSGIK